jgi:competence protein ComFC
MSSLFSKVHTIVDYLLGFVLDDLEVLQKIKKVPEERQNEWLKSNFGLNLKEDLPDFNHLYNYEHKEIQDIVWQLKFNDNFLVAEIFGRSLSEKIRDIIKDQQNFYLIPIPIHKKRRRERGYNQCEWLCENIIKFKKDKKVQNIFYRKDLIYRIIYTQKQSWHNDRSDRLNAVKNIYKLNKDFCFKDKNFILIDDVYTTGATINEARRLLLAAGAKNVLILTIAH